MLAQTTPWYAHALQRTAAGPAEPLPVPARVEWTTRQGSGPGAETLGPDLRRKRVLELGCGPGHNAACLAVRHGARVTGVDLVGLQVMPCTISRHPTSPSTRSTPFSAPSGSSLPNSCSLPSRTTSNRAACSPSQCLTPCAPADVLPPTTGPVATPSSCLIAAVCPSFAGTSTQTAGRSTSTVRVSGSPRPRSSTTPASTAAPPLC
jgi:hypothetical protein